MNPQEKTLIDSVFDRLAQGATANRDVEAMDHIQDRTAKQPDAVYGMVQAILIQEMALNQASARIAEMERQLAQANGQPQGQPQGASFLGNAGPWGRAPAPQPAPVQPQYQPQPQYASGPWGPSMQPAGGGFLHNMASMAAGVAAGSLLADGLASLFGGRHMFGGGFGGPGFGSYGGMGGFGTPSEVENVTINNYGGAGEPHVAGGNDAAFSDGSNYQDASFDPSAIDTGGVPDDGGGFDGGGFDSSDA